MNERLNDRSGHVAIVTGAARNIGRAIALDLVQAGARIIVSVKEAVALAEETAGLIWALVAVALRYVGVCAGLYVLRRRILFVTMGGLVRVPVLVMHGAADALIPGASHNDLSGHGVTRRGIDFVTRRAGH